MENEELPERHSKILGRVKTLIDKAQTPEPDSITLDKATRKHIKFKLISVIGLLLVSASFNAYTLMQNNAVKAELQQLQISKTTETSTHTQQITALQDRLTSKDQQYQALDLKQRQTEDSRYQAQRKLNRTTEQLAQMQGNTKEAKLMLEQLQILLK